MYSRMPLANSTDKLQRHENDNQRCRNNMNNSQRAVCRKAGIKTGCGGKSRSLGREKQDITSACRCRQANEHEQHDYFRNYARQ